MRRNLLVACAVTLVVIGAVSAASSRSLARGATAVKAAPQRSFPTSSGLCSRRPKMKRFVSTAGSDRNSGTLRHPWRTIQKALRTAVPGEAVYVRSGTYGEWATASRRGTATSPISLRAYPGEQPSITGRLKIVGAYLCVTGFRFKGQTPANREGVLIYPAGARHVELFRNVIVDAWMSGIYVGDESDPSEDINIIGNYIARNGTHGKFDHGVYFGHGHGGIIANNVVVQNRALGLKIAPEANRVTVTQNTVAANGTSGIIVGGEESWSSNDNVVVNNIVAFNDEWGIRSYWERKVGKGNRAIRNLVFSNGSGAFWFPGGGLNQHRSVFANPRFISSGNYRLRVGSPAVNRAIPAFSMRVDYTGRKRPAGRRPDLGAFER
jgi:hypothetical protein